MHRSIFSEMQSKTGAWEGGWESHESAVARGRPAVALRERQRRTRKRNCCCLDEPDLRVNHAKGKWRTSLGWWFPPVWEASTLQLGSFSSAHAQISTLHWAQDRQGCSHTAKHKFPTLNTEIRSEWSGDLPSTTLKKFTAAGKHGLILKTQAPWAAVRAFLVFSTKMSVLC